MGEITELGKLFLSSMDGPVDTAAFMTRLADILATDEDAKLGGNYFDVFVCEKNGGIVNIKEKHFFSQDQIMGWLFDHCGSRAWEIIQTEPGTWKRFGNRVNWTYTIYVERKV